MFRHSTLPHNQILSIKTLTAYKHINHKRSPLVPFVEPFDVMVVTQSLPRSPDHVIRCPVLTSTNACVSPYPRNRVHKGAMEEASSSRDESAKSKKSVVFGKLSKQLKHDRDQQALSPQTLSQTSSMAVNVKGGVKIEDKLNYYHLVQLNELFKV